MIIEYDDEADALYVAFDRVGPGDARRQRELDARRIVDYDQYGDPIGVEFFDYSNGIELEGVPRADEIAQTLIALLAPRQAVLSRLDAGPVSPPPPAGEGEGGASPPVVVAEENSTVLVTQWTD